MKPNPFRPTAGKRPPVLIGRDYILDDFQLALDEGAGAPGRLMLISGNRGYGKTVLLREIEKIASSNGWFVISDNAAPGLVERLVEALESTQLQVKEARLGPSLNIAGVASASLGSVTFKPKDASVNLRNLINDHLQKMKPGKGILITIDEAQGISLNELAVLALTIQQIIGDQDKTGLADSEQKGISLVFASLPSIVEDLQNHKYSSFLRRAMKEELTGVFLPDVRDAYIDTVTANGKQISEELALRAAREADGQPYFIQLIGYYMWRAAEQRGSDVIEAQDIKAGKANALLAFYDAVCGPVYYSLRSPDRLFIEAMAKDEGEFSNVSDIQQRCDRSAAWVAKYRTNLIREHIIEAVGYGQVRFIVPHLGEYIRDKVLWHE